MEGDREPFGTRGSIKAVPRGSEFDGPSLEKLREGCPVMAYRGPREAYCVFACRLAVV